MSTDHGLEPVGTTGHAERAPAGWYPDPEHPGWVRYWDGDMWFKSSPIRPTIPNWVGLLIALLILGLIGFFCVLALAAALEGASAGL